MLCAGEPLLEGRPAPALAPCSIPWGLHAPIGLLSTQAMGFGPAEAKREPGTPGGSGVKLAEAVGMRRGLSQPLGMEPGGTGAAGPGGAGRAGWMCVGKGAAKFLVSIQAPESQK